MSRSKNKLVALLATVGVFGFAMGAWAPAVSAQVSSFNTAIYSGRYACNITSDAGFLTAVIKYNPLGNGKYHAGTLLASANSFGVATPNISSFCRYTLNTVASSYTVTGQGIGFENLAWTAVAGNDASCPPSFVDQTTLAVRNLTNANGITQSAEIADVNLLDQVAIGVPPILTASGRGYCLK
jgi:hypothetical protein